MNELKSREDVITTKTDKGGSVVITDVISYIAEADRQMNNGEFYKKLPNDPNQLHVERINNIIDQLNREELISDEVGKGLKVHSPKTAKFSLLPKVHNAGNPGRPVISSVEYHPPPPPPHLKIR